MMRQMVPSPYRDFHPPFGQARLRWFAGCLALAVGWTTGCESDTPAESPVDAVGDARDVPSADALGDEGVGEVRADATDGEATGDGATTDPWALDLDAPDLGEPSPYGFTQPWDFPITGWLGAALQTSDPVFPQLESGTFEMPEAGVDDNGIEWVAFEPGPSGEMYVADSGLSYSVAEFVTERPTGLVVRSDATWQVYLNGALQPGDLYDSGTFRVPMRTRRGNNVVVIRGIGGLAPEATFEQTPDELYLNIEDVTYPEPVEGATDAQWIGIHVLNLSGDAVHQVTATLLASAHWEETHTTYPSLAAGATTQLAFELRPSGPIPESGTPLPVRFRLASDDLNWPYEREIELVAWQDGRNHRRTFRSAIDGSAQFFSVRSPKEFDSERDYALVLALHGSNSASVALASAYSSRTWAYIIAPMNRRRYGFDWEEWGRRDAIETLDHAAALFGTDPTQVYLTGHSMGGHGAWHIGVHFPGRFAVVGPSGGWESFQSYVAMTPFGGAVGRATAASQTLNYTQNLLQRPVFIIHGELDEEVPVSESRDMFAHLTELGVDVAYHEEPGAGHWWDGSVALGTDCVDWPELFELMQATRLDPTELDFDLVMPSPSVNDRHSYVVVESITDPYQDIQLTSAHTDDQVVLTTENVRSMTLDGAALADLGVDEIEVDGLVLGVGGESIEIGPRTGKRTGVHGPFYQVFYHPFCFAYAEDDDFWPQYAAFLISNWALRGNGLACAVPISDVDAALRETHNIVYLGVPSADIPVTELPFTSDPEGIELGGESFEGAAAIITFPDGDRLSAAMTATASFGPLLYRLPSAPNNLWQPFASGYALPDYVVYSSEGPLATGFFDGDWRFDASLRE